MLVCKYNHHPPSIDYHALLEIKRDMSSIHSGGKAQGHRPVSEMALQY